MQDPIIVNSKPDRPPRRSYTKEFKVDIVAQCERGDRSLAQVAMDNQINANLLRRWQRELNGDFGPNKLLPVKVAQPMAAPTPSEYIEIDLSTKTLKVMGAVDSHYVAQLLRALR